MDALPFRVEPRDDESCLGWTIRLAHENLLPSPWHLFTAVGMTQSNMALLRFDPARLAALAGIDAERLRALSCSEEHRRSAWVMFRGQAIGRTKLRNRVPQVCPQCLKSHGYARAVWDLLFVTACAEHKIQLIERCGSCGNRLSWLRPGIDVCRCSAAISASASPGASDGAVAISALMECMITRSPVVWEKHVGPLNAAVECISSLPLAYGCALISGLAGIVLPRKGITSSSNVSKIVEAAGEIIRAWPQALHNALDLRAARQLSSESPGTSWAGTDAPARAVLQERRIFHRIALAHGVADELIAPEFLRFIANRLSDLFVDARVTEKMRRLGIEPCWIGRSEAAQRLAIDARTLDRLIDEGQVHVRHVERAGQHRTFVRVADLHPGLGSLAVLPFRSVVASTGLPAQVLRELRTGGEFPHSNRGARAESICARDVEEFTKRWSRVAVHHPPSGCDTIPLHQALRLPLVRSQADWKAELVRRVLAGKLPAYAVRTKPILDATLSKSEVLSIKEQFERQRLSIGDVSTSLGLSKLGLLRLIVNGELRADFSEPEIKIQKSDLQTFEQRFIRLRVLVGSQSRAKALAASLDAAGIPLLRAEGHGGLPAFVKRADANRVRCLARQKLGPEPPPRRSVLSSHDTARAVPRSRGSRAARV